MIVSRPKGTTLASFILFSLITLVVLVMNVLVLIDQPNPAWYTYAIIGVLTPIFGFVVYRIFIRYKILKLGNNQVEIYFPVLRFRKVYPLQDIRYWIEHKVKTSKSSAYREVEIGFADDKKVTFGFQEYSDYPKMVNYLQMKVAKKRKG